VGCAPVDVPPELPPHAANSNNNPHTPAVRVIARDVMVASSHGQPLSRGVTSTLRRAD
jgi:hypothetical protein